MTLLLQEQAIAAPASARTCAMRGLAMVVALFSYVARISAAETAWKCGSSFELVVQTSQSIPQQGWFNISSSGSNSEDSQWVVGQEPAFYCNGEWLSPSQGNLAALKPPAARSGHDPDMGNYTALDFFLAQSSSKNMATGALPRFLVSFVCYEQDDAISFFTTYIDGCSNTNTSAPPSALNFQQPSAHGKHQAASSQMQSSPHAHLEQIELKEAEFEASQTTSSEFPAFATDSSAGRIGHDLAFYTWRGRFMHDKATNGIGLQGYQGGATGGPVLFTEQDAWNADSFMIAPSDHSLSVQAVLRSACRRRQSQNGTCTLQQGVDYYGNDLYSVPNVQSA